MDFKSARKIILTHLHTKKGATNSKLIDLIGGDVPLFERVKEDLIFKDLAEDKKGAGLVYIGPEKANNDLNTEIQSEQNFNTTESASYKIFISYGRKDAEEIANKLLTDLRIKGHEVWLDKEQIRTGTSWEEQIENAILSCDFFISLLTPHAVRRPDGICLDEISLARYNNRRIVPVMLINCRPPLGIFRLDWLDLQDSENPVSYEKTLARILMLLQLNEQEVEGIHSNIFSLLKPIDFKLDIYRHVKDFTGREWILKVIQEWINKSSGKVLFITGNPGTGKTALMSKLIHIMPQIGAFHFCIAKFEISLIPEKFIHSIASQLATQLPEYREIISLLNLQSLVYQESGALIKQLIIDPLAQIRRIEPLVIIIDALDEALYKGIENIAKLLFNWIDDLPSWVKIVITSRKVPEILGMFDFYKPFEIEVNREENRNDIKKYVFEMLSQKKGITSIDQLNEDLTEKIVTQSDGIFLYAKTIVQNLLNGTFTFDQIDRFPPGLGGMYQMNFHRLFINEEKFQDVRPLLEIILASYNPLTLDELAHYHSGTRHEIKRLLQTLAEFFPENDGTFSAFHKSLTDWLLGMSNQHHLYICDIIKGHTVIADILFKDLEEDRRTEYGVKYLPKHLFYAGRLKEMQQLLNDIHYIEARSAIHEVYSLIEDYKLYLSGAPIEKRNIGSQSNDQIWDFERHSYESNNYTSSLTPDKKTSAILNFLYRQAGLFQLYGNIPGFVPQQAFNDGLIPIVFQENSRISKINLCFLLTDSFRKRFDPFPLITMEFREHKLGISDLSISRDAQWLVSASFDKTVRLWNLDTGECIKSLKLNYIVETLGIVPDASYIAIAGADEDFCIQLYDYKLENIVNRLPGHSGRIMMMKISLNNRLVSCSSDHKLLCWNLTNKTIIFKKHYNSGLLACSISDNGSTIAVSTSENIVEVWNIDFDLLIFSLNHNKGVVRAVSLTSDGQELIIGGGKDKQTEVWDLMNQKLMYTISGHGTTTYSLLVNSLKTILITGGKDLYLKIWDFRSGNLIKMFESHSRVTRRIVATDDLRTVISGGGWNSDYNIRKLDVTRSPGIDDRSFESTSVIALIHSESKNWIIGATRKSVFRIDNKTGELKVLRDNLSVQSAEKFDDIIFFTTNSRKVISYRMDSGIWNDCFEHNETISAFMPISHENWLFGDIKGNVVFKKNNEIKIFSRLDDLMIRQIFISNQYFVILSYNDQFHFINIKSGEISHTYRHTSRITSNVIISEEKIYFGDTSGSIIKFNLIDKSVREISNAHKSEITSISLFKNGRIVTGCCTGNIKIWDPTLTYALLEFKGHESSVNFLYTLEGPYFLSTGGNQYSVIRLNDNEAKDTSLKKWSTITGECVAVYPANELITSLNIEKQGVIITGYRNGLIHEFCNQIPDWQI
jgi:WD40 repeat protein